MRSVNRGLVGKSLIAFSCLFLSAARTAPHQLVPQVRKVMVVIFENTDYASALAKPFFGKLAHDGALLSNVYAETHPSQANYIALTSGDLHGVTGDANVNLAVRHLGDLLKAKGKTWKVYAEGYPGNCFLGARSGSFARKHVPFLSYVSVQSTADCQNIVPGTQMARDLAAGTLPDFSLYVPDMNNDGHDTGVDFADRWYSATFGPLLADPRFADVLLMTTFDESSLAGGNHIYSALNGKMVVPGSNVTTRTDHFGLLHTIEVGLGLDTLGLKDAQAPVVQNVWR